MASSLDSPSFRIISKKQTPAMKKTGACENQFIEYPACLAPQSLPPRRKDSDTVLQEETIWTKQQK